MLLCMACLLFTADSRGTDDRSPMPRHPLSRMAGRNPAQRSRAATPLELLFDLACVTAFGVASSELAIRVAAGEFTVAVLTFVAVMMATSWDWISFTWFASSYDTDDWLYRLTIMMQMVGVIVFTTGIPEVFRFIAEGGHLDNSATLTGYIVMRSMTMLQRVRSGIQDPRRRRTNALSATPVAIALVGWCALTLMSPDRTTLVIVALALFAVELTGPVIAERGNEPQPCCAGARAVPDHHDHVSSRRRSTGVPVARRRARARGARGRSVRGCSGPYCSRRAAGADPMVGSRRDVVHLAALAVAGVLLAGGTDAGLYAYAAAAVAALVFGVNGAWVFLTRAGVAPDARTG